MDSDRPWQSYHTVFTNAKAGMDGVDKEKVQKIVYEMSKGSKYFENEQKKEAVTLQKVQQMQHQACLLTEADLARYEKVADAKIAILEAERNLSRIWMHVDMDAFYAAVETLENPSLAGKPMAVGGMSMICTANYEARKFGVRAAMPGFIACKLCPDLIFVPTNFTKYTIYSEKVRQVFREYDPHFLPRSLDEAYLDITEPCRLRNMSPEEVAEEVRKSVYERTGLTCSAGIGPNRMIAKVCSDINKPNGQYIVPNNKAAVLTFISTLPIRKVPGIGKVTERLLKDICDVKACEDILKKKGLITALFSSLSSDFFLAVGLGIGGSDTPIEEKRKSLSCERTFSAINDEVHLYEKLVELAESLAKDMETESLQGRTLTLKLKTVKFEVRTRSLTLPFFVYKKEDLMLHASKILKAELPVSLRLMGLRISHFQGETIETNQRTLGHYFSSGGGDQQCSIPEDNYCSLACDNEAEDFHDPETKTSSQFCIDNYNHFGDNDNNPENMLNNEERLKLMIQQSKPCSSSAGPPISNQSGKVDHFIKKMESDSRKCKSDASSRDVRFDVYDDEKDIESRIMDTMTWHNDECSLCKIEIPSFLTYERQEHMDFHFAQMLQRQYSSNSLDTLPRTSRQNKRPNSSSSKDLTSKKGKLRKTDSSTESRSHLPIDAFFLKK